MIVGVVGNAEYDGLRGVLEKVAAAADGAGVSLRSEADLEPYWSIPGSTLESEPLDALLTLGGDGTLLRGARQLAGRGVPVLGINLGRVGFLTAVTRDGIATALAALFSGRFEVEERLTLQSWIEDHDGRRELPPAVNDVVVHKAGVARIVRLDVMVNDERVGPYSADGLIVATPTGSTAYSLSAGGPILAPGTESIVLTPICAHTLAVRPFVIPARSRVTIFPVPGWAEELMVSVDGQEATRLQPGERVLVRCGDDKVRLVRLSGARYFERVRDTLRWGDLSEREGP